MTEMHFEMGFGMVPERLTLRKAGFEAAWEACRIQERQAGRTATLDALYAEIGVNDRVVRRVREGNGKLPRHQVEALAKRLGCRLLDIAERPDADHERLWNEQDRREMAAWPVPLREVDSWVTFARYLSVQDSMDRAFGDDVLDLASAAAIDAFWLALDYAIKRMPDHHAVAAATLKDAAIDLAVHGPHVIFWRYMRRANLDDGRTDLQYAMVIRIRRESEDLAFTIDRSHEPFFQSEREDWDCDDAEMNECWTRWEGKDRLSLWRTGPTPVLLSITAGRLDAP